MEKSRRGFAAMSPEMQRRIASMGGIAGHKKGKSHKFTPEEASAASAVAHKRGTAHEWTPEEAAEAGRKGGKARWVNAKNRTATAGVATGADTSAS